MKSKDKVSLVINLHIDGDTKRFIAACFALVAILAGRGPDGGVSHDDRIGFAVDCADALLKVLKDTA